MLEALTLNEFPNQTLNPNPPIILNGEPKYNISEVLESQIDKQHKCKLVYLVKWVGYKGTDEETSWIPASKLNHATKVIADFHQVYPSEPGSLPLAESWFS